jgi:alpha-glucosidase (family GH31 glycosyl hydrolase)
MEKIRMTERALYFCNAQGLYFRLTYEGTGAWRLLTSKKPRAFDTRGAAQALAEFMGESIKGGASRLSYCETGKTLTVSERGGSKAILSLGDTFSLKFSSKEGKVITNLTDVGYEDESLYMRGSLAKEEAIYGGGERLDVANKRGTAFDLYTCDGWNNSATTYVAIPVFMTTLGGGMYVNRNEVAVVDFGKADPDAWFYKLLGGDMDCYFYPTGNMADVLRGYTELTGHADMPAPWMQDMHVCRYGPDFWSFEEEKSFASIEEAPDWEKLFVAKDREFVDWRGLAEAIPYASLTDAEKARIDRFYLYNEGTGRYLLAYVKNDAGLYFPAGRKGNPGGSSCKTIMQRFIDADMKPAAASMEGYNWGACFRDSDVSRANKEDLSRAVAWLHAHGLRAMVYIRAGGVDAQDIGFRPEYKVHADVEITNEDGSVTVKEDTVDLPWVVGTGENPDVGRFRGAMRTRDYLDITNEEAVEWYFDKLWGEMIDLGVDGAKIDFCECMPDGEKQIGIIKTHYKWKDPSKIVSGTEHHAYPVYFISAFYRRMLEHKAKKGLRDGFMVFSRGGGIGSQRNPYMWSGDQARQFEKLDDQLLAVVNSGLSGVPFMSFDMAGYAYTKEDYFTVGKERESEIFARSVAFTAFLTQMQTHGDVRHAYEMTEQVQQIYRNFTRLHGELLPYVQRYSRIACETGMPPVRHLVLNYPDDASVYDLNDEFMLGEGLLVAPILTENTFARDVYLPAGDWIDLLTGARIAGGRTVRSAASLGQIPVFLNLASRDAEELLCIFEGQNWRQIKNYR